MVIKDYKNLIGLQHIHLKQMKRLWKNHEYKNDQFDDYVNDNKTENDKIWPYTPDNTYRILILVG